MARKNGMVGAIPGAGRKKGEPTHKRSISVNLELYNNLLGWGFKFNKEVCIFLQKRHDEIAKTK